MIPSEKIEELKSHVDDISNYDFFSGDASHFCINNKGVESKLMWGTFEENIPCVSVIIPTYKRKKLLFECINSVLNQREFDDFEIIIMDNDYETFGMESDVWKMISEINSEKIKYFQNSQSAEWREDQGVKMARTPWFVFLHDDDLLHPDTLKILVKTVKENPDIKWLSADHGILAQDEFLKNQQLANDYKKAANIYYYDPKYACYGYVPYWQGAIINREAYINIGGMLSKRMGCGDMLSVPLFARKYPMWVLDGVGPLYFYRLWEGQDSANGTYFWTKNYISEYLFFKFVNKKYHMFHRIFDYREWKQIEQKIENCNKNLVFNTQIDIREVVKYCDIKEIWLKDTWWSRFVEWAMWKYYNLILKHRKISNKYYRKVEI